MIENKTLVIRKKLCYFFLYIAVVTLMDQHDFSKNSITQLNILFLRLPINLTFSLTSE